MKLHKSENKRKAEWTYTKCGLVVNGKYIVKCWKDVTCKICLKRRIYGSILAKAVMDVLKSKKMNDDILLVCNKKERKGMSTMTMDKYIE